MQDSAAIREKRRFSIRRAGAEDGPAILACLAAAFAPYRDQYTAGAFADTVMNPDAVWRRLRQMCVLVAVSGSEIVGTIGGCSNGEEGHLRGMAVLPACHGTGVAPALLQAAEAELRQQGCRRVTLDTTAPLERAIRFYEKHGYARSGRVRDFYGMTLHEYVKPL